MQETIYCLNNDVIFTPSRRTLSRRDSKAEPIILNDPTAKILHILLSCDGVTSQKELYESAWKDNGSQITPNNLYQNISILRRSLNTILMKKDDYIITVPRQGFYISQYIHVDILNDEPAVPPPEVHHLPFLPMSSADHPRDTVLAKMLWRVPDPFADAIKRNWHQKILLLTIPGALLLVFYSVTTLGIWNSGQLKTPSFFSDYVYFNKIDGCTFYFSPDADKLEAKTAIINRTGTACATYPWRYVSWLEESLTVSVIACHNEITDGHNGRGCVSWKYQGLLKNE